MPRTRSVEKKDGIIIITRGSDGRPNKVRFRQGPVNLVSLPRIRAMFVENRIGRARPLSRNDIRIMQEALSREFPGEGGGFCHSMVSKGYFF